MPLLERVQQPIGSSGIPLIGSQSWQSDEYNVDLSTPQRAVATYDRMRRGDATVRASANNLFHALLAAEWRIDAAKDDAQGEEIAQFVRSVLMPGETYGYSGTSSWYATLRNALPAALNGFSILEKIWAWRPRDGKQVYAALEARFPKTIVHWNLSKTGPSTLESVTQSVQTRNGGLQEKDIPAKYLIVTVFNREGDNYWGESVLRPAHFHWRMKQSILGWDGIQKERMGGIFWVTSKEGTKPTSTQIRNAKAVLQNFRIHEKQGLYFPHVFEFHALFPNGESAKFIESAEYHDRQIERTMMSQFQSIASGELGNKGIGDVQLDFMLLAYQGAAKLFEDSFGEQAIVDLVNTNYGEREFYPRLACENFLQMRPDRLAEVMKPLVEVGLVRVDRPIRVYFRKKFSLPEEDEATLEPIPSKPDAFGGGGTVARPAKEGDAPAEADAGAKPPGPPPPPKAARDVVKRAPIPARPAPPADRPFWRDALPHEQHVAFEGMRRYLDEEPARIWYRVISPIRKDQISALAQAAAGATEAQLAQGRIPYPDFDRLAAALEPALLDVYRAGRTSVLEEAKRAGVTISKADASSLEGAYPPEPTKKQATWILRLAQAFALGMTTALWSEAIRAGQAAQDQELPPAEIEISVRRALEALSENVVRADVAGRVVDAFTTGRVEQGQAMSDEISSVFYSARMDDGTCPPCASLDGMELDTEDYGSYVPNPECEGGDRCRCEPIFVFRSEAAPAAA